MPLLRRCLLKTSPYNQEKLLEKREDSNFKEQSHWVNKMGEDRVG
jgi:hypothetical protein